MVEKQSDTQPGEEVWSFKTGGHVFSSPTVVDGTVYFGSYDTNLYAVDSSSGDKIWDFKTGDRVRSSPAVVGDTVYVGSDDNNLYAVSASDGTEEWRFETGDSVESSPTVADGAVYVGSDDNNLYSLNASSGEEEWWFEADSRGRLRRFTTVSEVRSSPTVADGTVYIGSGDGHLYAVEASSGEVIWSFRTLSKVRSSPTVVDGTVYVGSKDKNLYAVDASDGTEEWSFHTENYIQSSPTVADETVYVCSFGRDVLWDNIHAVDASTGERIWSLPTGHSRVHSSPTVVDGTVYVGSRNNHLYAVDASSGDERWTFETGNEVWSSPTVVDGTVYFGSNDGNLYAVDAGVSGSSEDSRVLSGTLGHHDKCLESEPDEELRETLRHTDDTDTEEVSTGYEELNHPGTTPSVPSLSVDYKRIGEHAKQPVGSGGNADVYKTTYEGETIALKEPRMSGTLHRDVAERFMKEAETWDKLDDHENIVSVIDYGSEPLPWIALEYMGGGDLSEGIDEMTFDEKLWSAVQVTKAVRHAHRRGIAHLDLKPENVLFRKTDDGYDVPKVADWGLAKMLLEHSKSVEGISPQYSAPEQFNEDEYGKPDDLTDVYQLGTVFYEMFTGRPPFEGKPSKVMHSVLYEEVEPPAEVNPDLPKELDDILLKALEKDREDRYETVIYMRDDLRELYESI